MDSKLMVSGLEVPYEFELMYRWRRHNYCQLNQINGLAPLSLGISYWFCNLYRRLEWWRTYFLAALPQTNFATHTRTWPTSQKFPKLSRKRKKKEKEKRWIVISHSTPSSRFNEPETKNKKRHVTRSVWKKYPMTPQAHTFAFLAHVKTARFTVFSNTAWDTNSELLE